MSIATLLLAWTPGTGSAAAPVAASPEGDEATRLIHAAIDEEVASGFSGAVLVARGERVLVEGVFGSMQGKPLPPDGRFLIASAAKQFVSASLLKLQDMGKLDLDDPVGKYFADVPADKRAITIRQLLTHTSGLPQGYDSESATRWQEATRAVFAMAMTAAPGEKFQYSNENYQLGVALVEVVSGRRYVDFLRQELLEPIGLKDTGSLQVPGSAGKLSPLSDPLPSRLVNLQWGGFGFYTTPRDFRSWYRAIRSGNRLSEGSVKELFAPAVKIGEGHSALGWFIGAAPGGGERIFTRGNDDIGSSSVLYAYPASDVLIIVLSHAGQKNEELSWARAVHARIEESLFPAPAG